MEKVRGWFGTPTAAAKTILWLCWVWFLVSVLLSVLGVLLFLAALGVRAVVT